LSRTLSILLAQANVFCISFIIIVRNSNGLLLWTG
jgi:hypothetical protein